MKKILHITESFGGGVSTAINTYASLTADCCEHYLFARLPVDSDTCLNLDDAFVKYDMNFPCGFFNISKAIKKK